ncbi:hypothetical protein TPY_2551 [Sulfobacillus acidophilus TPY]|uniref:Type I-B CRISPR-associated protein Cas8b/Csh1 n=1 Tax=Sulfobacillus acidophilus (strain ATCC 700253 / DSM 10332 / NAL) TaxID=679936 RepID=G8TT48_SULAD|nr:hypothetical protein TPY_2551 [Sulfobacillus acidophilus TPY]AEW06748.1 hypothetical protein Sulac_3302 [Sulfobacillus acidophilus DSM 10332]
MLIENLIRVGRPLISENNDLTRLIQQLTDIDGRARDFYQQVIIVELGEGQVKVHSHQQWGLMDTGGKKFIPDDRTAIAPVAIPSTGNPINPQGRYGFPAYPFFKKDQINSAFQVEKFLRGRLVKTRDASSKFDEYLAQIAQGIVDQIDFLDDGKGLILLCHPESKVYYRALKEEPLPQQHRQITASIINPTWEIRADLTQIVEGIWWAKLEEGSHQGRRSQGQCSICKKTSEVVSIYAKAWSWFSVTWTAPLPQDLDSHHLDEGVALCGACYGALTMGAKWFERISQPLPPRIMQEAFAASHQHRSLTQIPAIRGTVLVTPLLDDGLSQQDWQRYIRGIQKMESTVETSGAVRHLDQVLGIPLMLPEELDQDTYRLATIYYSVSNADVQLWSYVDDIMPSDIDRLSGLVGDLNYEAANLELRPTSLPALLGRMYGSGALWAALSTVLHHRPLSRERVVERVSQNLTDYGRTIGLDPRQWTLFQVLAKQYALFHQFWYQYMSTIESFERGQVMKPWQTLLTMWGKDVNNWQIDNLEDLGFMMGLTVHQFAQHYYNKTHKDYLQSRVMTFGSNLTPDVIGHRALGRIEELALKLQMPLNQRFVQKVALCLSEFLRQSEDIQRHKDRFMSSFWAGYGLYRLPLGGEIDNEEVFKEA